MAGPDDPIHVDLTPREREVLAMVAEGKTNREIGTALFISESTAGVHVSNIMAKLGVGSRTEAATLVTRAGLVDAAPMDVADSVVFPDPASTPSLEPPVRTGWRERLKVQMRTHPRSTAIAGGTVVVLAAITTGLAFAVLTSDRPIGNAGTGASSTAVSGDGSTPTATPRASHILSPTPSPTATASVRPSASASPTASATSDPAPSSTPAPIAAPTPSPNVTWKLAGGGIDGHYDGTATVLQDGSVLVVGGGIGHSPCTATVVRYRPTADAWTEEEPANEERCGHTATLLPDGTVLVAGGNAYSTIGSTAEIFDPDAGTWTVAAELSTRRVRHTATALLDGRVLVVGGMPDDGSDVVLDSAELYDPGSGTWTVIDGPADPRAGHTATRLEDGSVLVSGGPRGCCGVLDSTELFDPTSDTWSNAAPMTRGRWNGAATLLPDGRVLVAGGGTRNLTGSLAAEFYDPDEDRWTATGSMTEERWSPTLTVLDNGHVIAWGGGNSSDAATAEEFDPDRGTWRFDGSLPFLLFRHTATLLESRLILIVGGRASLDELMGTILYIPLGERD